LIVGIKIPCFVEGKPIEGNNILGQSHT
jgi:hypothetical protein